MPGRGRRKREDMGKQGPAQCLGEGGGRRGKTWGNRAQPSAWEREEEEGRHGETTDEVTAKNDMNHLIQGHKLMTPGDSSDTD